MSSKQQLAVVTWGDPRDPATWSGTSSNVIAALEKRGVDVLSFDCSLPEPRWRLERLRDRARGKEYAFSLHRVGRRNAARFAQTLPSTCAGILHIGSYTVPVAGSTPGVRNFLMCDAMVDFWQKYALAQEQGTPRQQSESEANERASVAGCDLYFPISEHTAFSLEHHYGAEAEKITAVGTGRGQITPLQGTKDYARKNILMVARVRFEDKGGPLLIKALQIARETDPQLHLTLVSPAEFRPFTEGAAGVTLTGRVEWSELQRLFDEACLYAMPAQCEPWGLVYAEALATKTPILGLNRASLPEITHGGEYGFLVEEPTPQAVAAALLDAVSDPQRLRVMGEAGQKYCLNTFTWERTAARLCERIFDCAT